MRGDHGRVNKRARLAGKCSVAKTPGTAPKQDKHVHKFSARAPRQAGTSLSVYCLNIYKVCMPHAGMVYPFTSVQACKPGANLLYISKVRMRHAGMVYLFTSVKACKPGANPLSKVCMRHAGMAHLFASVQACKPGANPLYMSKVRMRHAGTVRSSMSPMPDAGSAACTPTKEGGKGVRVAWRLAGPLSQPPPPFSTSPVIKELTHF
eukprot:1156127-Pelagomonas_calceolata.AAC.2